MKRILVIEDDDAVRNVIVEALLTRGWRSIEASDGAAGLEAALGELPDLILCDIQMPKMDGFQVLKGVRDNGAMVTVPFIFLTGHGDKPMMRQGMELGADDFLVKPFTISELLAALDARFQKQAVLEETADKKLHALRESLRFALPHELVTPLNTILGFAGLLLDETSVPKPPEMREYASHIKVAGERLRDLIEKFLIYAQVELAIADHNQREAYASRLPSPTEEGITAVAQRIARGEQRDGDLVLNVAPMDHRIAPSHLERLVRELVENACRFSAPGSPIWLTAHGKGTFLELRVLDRGRGLSAEQIRQVSANIQFERKLTEQQGSGLGLAICRRIAELYGGSLEIQSIPGERTEVVVYLPP